MRQSRHIGKTAKEAPRDAQTASQKLLSRAGLIRQTSPGIFACMPFFLRSLNRIKGLLRNAFQTLDAEELLLPALQTRELWTESGRWEKRSDSEGDMFSFKDRRGVTICLAPAYDEQALDIARREIVSYKQLPRMVYQFQTRFNDDPKPRAGLLEARENLTLDAFYFAADENELDSGMRTVRESLVDVCALAGVEVFLAEGFPDAGGRRLELAALFGDGEEKVLRCPGCGYAAMKDHAESRLETYGQDQEMGELQAVYGPGLIGVGPLAEFLQIPVWKTTKTIVFEADEQVVAVCVRGDCEVNEAKVKQRLGCSRLTLASAAVIRDLTGADVGYAGPLNLPKTVFVIADKYVDGRTNFECGANRTDYHYINVNFERDLPRPEFGDFKTAVAGHGCPRCDSGILQESGVIRLGYVETSGGSLSGKMNCHYLDNNGKTQPVRSGSCSLNLGRMAAAAIESSHDEGGIIWPRAIAPFDIHLVALNLEKENVKNEAESMYRQLQAAGFEVLFDDRDARAGEKFGDSDLFGIPVRITISKRTCEAGQMELKRRAGGDAELLHFGETLTRIKDILS